MTSVNHHEGDDSGDPRNRYGPARAEHSRRGVLGRLDEAKRPPVGPPDHPEPSLASSYGLGYARVSTTDQQPDLQGD